MLNRFQRSHDLLIHVSPANDTTAHRRSGPFLWIIQVVIILILLANRHISFILFILLHINMRHRKHHSRIVQQIPLTCIWPVSGCIVQWRSAWCGRTNDDVDFLGPSLPSCSNARRTPRGKCLSPAQSSQYSCIVRFLTLGCSSVMNLYEWENRLTSLFERS